MRRLKSFTINALYVLGTLLEAPFFLVRNRAIFANKIVYVFWQWSFGHMVGGLDFASRLYYPHRISLIFLPHEGSNSYLPFCFSHNMDAFLYRSRLLPQNSQRDKFKYDTLRFLLLVLSGLTRRFHVIEHLNVYKTVSLAENRLLLGNNETGSLVPYNDWTGYMRLLRDNIGRKPCLPQDRSEECRRSIQAKHPNFFDRPAVTLLLREKGRHISFDMLSRCSGPQENYLPLVRYLTTMGYHVVGAGETNHSVFAGVPGYFSLQGTNLPERLLSLFVFSNSVLFIGQDSGPLVLAGACGIPALATDIPFYRNGTFRREDIVLYKRFREKHSGRFISVVEAFRRHHDLVYGYNFDKKGVEILPNTPEELLEAGKEALALIQGQMTYSEDDKLLMDNFRALPVKEMEIYHKGNRTSIHILRQLKHELLERSYTEVA